MSALSIIQNILKGNNPYEKYKIGIQLNSKNSYFSIIENLLLNNNHVIILNYDLNFYKYYKSKNFKFNENKLLNKKDLNNLSKFDNTKIYIILGIDLISKDDNTNISELFKYIIKPRNCIVFFAYEKSFKNLDNVNIEYYNRLTKNCLDYLLIENTFKLISNFNNNNNININNFYNNKKANDNNEFYYILCNTYSFINNTFEYTVMKFLINIVDIDTISYTNKFKTLDFLIYDSYKKEYKDIFEVKEDESNNNTNDIEPMSTFNLQKTDEERINKEKVIVPHLKENNPNLISVDNEDIRELYDEDPDEDLDI